MQPGHKNQNKIEILTNILDWYPKLYCLDFKKFGNILVKVLHLRTSMHIKEQKMQNITFNLSNIPLCDLCVEFNAIFLNNWFSFFKYLKKTNTC